MNEIQIANLPNSLLLRSVASQSFFHFFECFWPALETEPLALNWHIRLMCDEAQATAETIFGPDRKPLRHNLIVNVPPGSTKSSILTVFLPVWCWIKDPTLRIITLSYSASLSMFHAQRSRDLIASPMFQETFGDLFELRKKDQNKKSEYGILYGPDRKVGGVRFTGSVGGSITGKHAHLLIYDDPLNAQQASSEKERDTANEFLTTTMNSRKVSMQVTPSILVMQRLHEDDPTAKLAKAWGRSGKLRWLRLPADTRYEIHPPELRGRYTQDGGLCVLDPMRKPTSVIQGEEAALSAHAFSGQYGQDPQPAEGNRLKKAWFSQGFNLAELRAEWNKLPFPPAWNATLDGAYTKRKSNSATGILVWAIWKGRLYLRNWAEWWVEFPDLVQDLPPFLRANGFGPGSTLFVEPKGPGKSLVQTLRRDTSLSVAEDPLPDGISQMEGKIARVDRSAPYLRGMNTFLADHVDWEHPIRQWATFPNASHTDLTDCLVMSVEKADDPSPLSDASLWGVSSV